MPRVEPARAEPPRVELSAHTDLPAARAAAVEASQAAFLSDLPVIAAPDLPVRANPSGGASLPVVAASLPSPAQGTNLPVVASSLPARASRGAAGATGNLPVVAPSLPSLAPSLPVKADPRANLPAPAPSLPVPRDHAQAGGGRGFGEIELPTVGDSYPPATGGAPSGGQKAAESAFGLFGEIDLPHESPPSSPHQKTTSSAPPIDFGDLELDDHRARSVRPPSATSIAPPGVRSDAPKAAGGMSFGEVDIGGSIPDEASIGLDSPERVQATEAPVQIGGRLDGEAVAARPLPVRPAEEPKKRRPIATAIGAGLFVLALLGGAALQVTPYGAFGYLFIGDYVHAGDYRRATAAAIVEGDKTAGADTYDAAKAAIDGAYAAQARTPRDKPLTAYAAFADLAVSARFGGDPARASRGKQTLASLPGDPPVQYGDAAEAARMIDSGDLRAGRAAVDAAAAHVRAADANDPLLLDLSLVAGNLALAAKDAGAALAAFDKALAAGNDARAHFGLARAYDLTGDAASMQKEIDATLAASPGHPAALTLRARPKSVMVDPAKALADLSTVLEGPSRAKASPQELSNAYAAKAWISLDRGGATDAREAFAQAVAIDPHNLDALNGQGRLFLNEERPAEALARFDTALGLDPNSPETIANDAEAKIALERLADAKQQLVAARAAFPKSIPILILLGKVEQHLGNNDAADADLRAAIALVDPARPDAVLPYVALSKLLCERGRLTDARTTLDDAKKKLTPSAALERALGQISELQADYEGAIAHFDAAVVKDPKDPNSHFLLGVALRRVRKFDDAGAELDKVAAVDKDYPGLSLERGLLFEESGDVEKAIEQFNGALAKAPDDPDLQLRVGAAYVAIGRPDDALPMLHKVLDKRPSSAEAHHYIGRALMLKGGQMQTDALRYLKRAVELDPNRAEFHVYVAWAANDAQPAQLELARDEIDRALALDTMNPEAYWQRGVLERMEGAVEDAIKDENKALSLRPSRYEARATLAECFEDKSQDAAALAEWAKAIAGDAEAPDADPVRHPFWRYRYGKLLMDKGGPGVALVQLLPAVTTAEKITPKPGWLAPLEFITAEALRKTGKRADAVDHYKRFLEIAPVNSPDRLDAQQALGALSPR
jgi:tetratricopeptide (TPR) repeat protein